MELRYLKCYGFIKEAALLILLLAGCAAPLEPVPDQSLPTPLPAAAATRLVALKLTDQARMQLTATAQPSLSPSHTPPPDAPPCRAADLRAEAQSEGATGSMVISLHLTNKSNSLCVLSGSPDIRLVDRTGNVLDIDEYWNCLRCSSEESASPTQSAQETATAREVLSGKVALEPGESATVTLIWNNWCQPFPEGGVWVQLTLPDRQGQLVVPSGARAGGRCDVPKARSTLMISQYSLY